MSRIEVFTSAAANYLPKVAALFESVRAVRPDWGLHLVLADEAPADALSALGAEVHPLSGLGVPAWRRWAFCHSLIELATAVKPFLLRRLLARPGTDAVLYFDPDILLFSRLEDVVAALADADIVLTPHQTVPETTLAGVMANEVCTLQHGVYNLGFIGVAARREGRAFADWWASRVYPFCREDIPSGLYTDQRWIDFVPAYFDAVRVLRGGHLNLAPWNLAHRSLARNGETWTVDGVPLGFLHFSAVDTGGFDAFAGDPLVSGLVADYRARTAAAPAAPWAYAAFTDGQPIAMEQRLVYRLRSDLQQHYPEPFASGPGAYQAWWAAEARNEFPGLFDPHRRAAEFARLSSALTTAFPDLLAEGLPNAAC